MCMGVRVLTCIINRKIRNRVASQNTRDKRKQYVADLELEVKRLKAQVFVYKTRLVYT